MPCGCTQHSLYHWLKTVCDIISSNGFSFPVMYNECELGPSVCAMQLCNAIQACLLLRPILCSQLHCMHCTKPVFCQWTPCIALFIHPYLSLSQSQSQAITIKQRYHVSNPKAFFAHKTKPDNRHPSKYMHVWNYVLVLLSSSFNPFITLIITRLFSFQSVWIWLF